MALSGRPGITYETFKKTWQALLEDGRAAVDATLEALGGSKSTIIKFREQFEQQQIAKSLALIEQIKLPEKIREVLASIAVERAETQERANIELQSRLKEYLSYIESSEKRCADREIELEDAKIKSERERLQWERRIAANDAKIDDLKQREQTLADKLEVLNDKYNQAKQEAAVIRKENDMLREQMPNKTKRKIESRPNAPA